VAASNELEGRKLDVDFAAAAAFHCVPRLWFGSGDSRPVQKPYSHFVNFIEKTRAHQRVINVFLKKQDQ
jgi:hypothetical protein